MYKLFFKRVIDFILVLLFLMIFSPIFLFVMIGLSLVNQGSPFFFQKRAGKNDKIFEIIKFKTMNDKKDASGVLLSDTERLTTFGAFVRKTSLDELPQFFNILKGEMSLIGPRPLLPEYLEFYSDYHKKRHWVRPGITGLAQVKGRNQMKFSERFNNDVYYVEHLSFILDCKIIILTIKSVLFKSSTVVNGQTVDEVDDLGISRNLSKNHFKK